MLCVCFLMVWSVLCVCFLCRVWSVLCVCFLRVWSVLFVCFLRVWSVLCVCFLCRVWSVLCVCFLRVWSVLFVCFLRVWSVLCVCFLCRVGSVLTLPMTVFLDWILKHEVMTWQSFIGVGAIVVGFFLLIVSEYWQMRQRGQEVKESEENVLRCMHGSINKSLRVGINSSPSKPKLQTILRRYLI